MPDECLLCGRDPCVCNVNDEDGDYEFESYDETGFDDDPNDFYDDYQEY